MKKTINIIWKVMLGALALFCAMCLYFSFFRADYAKITIDTYNPFILFLAAAFYIALLLASRKWLEYASERQLKMISAGWMAVFFAGLLFIGLSTRIIAKVDLRHAYIEAINMLETGEMTDIWQFGRYPHQKAVAFMLYFVYRMAGIFGCKDYRALGILFNAIMMTLALVFFYKFVKDYKGTASAVTAEMIFVCNPVLYYYVSYFYSDTLCMPFMLGGLWMAGRGLKENSSWKKAGFLVVSAITFAFGAAVRATVIFALAAVFLVVLSKEGKKAAIVISVFLVVGFMVGKAAYQHIDLTYAKNLAGAEDISLPVTHYLKMGSNEESGGRWNRADVVSTQSLTTHQEKIAGDVAVIRERIREMGLGRYLKLIRNKIALVWGDGRMGYPSYNVQMEQYNFVYEYSMGDKAIFLRHIMQFMRCGLYILMLIAAVMLCRKKELVFSDMALTAVILAGFAFYVFWEVHPKYSLMYLPAMSVIAGTGIEELYAARNIKSVLIFWKETDDGEKTVTLTREALSKTACGLLCVGMLITAFLWIGCYRKFAGEAKERSELRVNQEMTGKTQLVDQEGVLQSFRPEKEFNCVAVKFRNSGVTGDGYLFQILDQQEKVIVEQKFTADDILDDKYKNFRFDTIYPVENDVYSIKIFAAEEYASFLKVSVMYQKDSEAYASGYDSYEDGDLLGDGTPEHMDMTFRVTNIKMRSVVSGRVYLIFTFGSLLLEGMTIFLLCKAKKDGRDDK